MSKQKKAFKLILENIKMSDLADNIKHTPQLTLIEEKTHGCTFKYKKNYDPSESIRKLLMDAFKEYLCENYGELSTILEENDVPIKYIEGEYGFIDSHVDITIYENTRNIYLNFV